MPLHVVDVQLSDIPKLIEIEFLAYSQSQAAQILRGRDWAHWRRAYDRYRCMLKNADAKVSFRKVIDTDLPSSPPIIPPQWMDQGLSQPDPRGETIGWMRWETYSQGISEGHALAKRFDDYRWEFPSRMMEAVVRQYWELHELNRRVIMGNKPHVYLCLIAIHPDHQRRGAGTRLMEGFTVDSPAGLAAYCEASPEGRSLYHKFGFEERERVQFPVSALGGQGTRDCYCMVKGGIASGEAVEKEGEQIESVLNPQHVSP